MNLLETMATFGHEKVVFVSNPKAGLKAIIGIHSTALGPALGGCRLWDYASEEDALFDVLRLSRGMSHKNAAAGLALGGGKCVVFGKVEDKTEAMFEALGEAVESLGGQYITAEDVNTDTNDAIYMKRTTQYICGLPDVSGDPSPMTARGVMQGIRATAKVALGADSLDGLTFAIQGLGKVGYDVAQRLTKEGAKLYVADLRQDVVDRAVAEMGATAVPVDQILSQECDILAPCALGAIVNPKNIPNFHCKAIAGAANNLIYDDAAGEALKARGIAYAPDFIINGGGVINAGGEALGNYNEEEVIKKVDNIYNTIGNILEESRSTGVPEGVIATNYAENIIRNGGMK